MKEEEPNVDVTKEEMAEQYLSFNENLANKFNKGKALFRPKKLNNAKRANQDDSEYRKNKRSRSGEFYQSKVDP